MTEEPTPFDRNAEVVSRPVVRAAPDKRVPFDDVAEKAILMCFFTNPERNLADFMATMPDEAFYHPCNRLFYETLRRMMNEQRPVEPMIALSFFMQIGVLDKIGGPGAFAEISSSLLESSQYGYNKRILSDLLTLRRIIETCEFGLGMAYAHAPSDSVRTVMDQFEQSVIQLRESNDTRKERTFKEMVNDRMDWYDAAILNGGMLPGISTGYARLDRATAGMREGQVWTFGGGTSDGKSAFIQNIVANLGRARVPTTLYTLEMTDDENVDRFFSIQSCVPSLDFLYGLQDKASQKAAQEAAKELAQWPIEVVDVSGIRLSALRADMRKRVRRNKTRVFVLDYLQLIAPDTKGHNREREVAEISAAMKAEAKLLHATVINLSQLNNDGRLRESASIGQDSDLVGLLEAPLGDDGEKIEHQRRLIIAKVRGNQRNPPPLWFDFHGPTYTFNEIDPPEQPDKKPFTRRKR